MSSQPPGNSSYSIPGLCDLRRRQGVNPEQEAPVTPGPLYITAPEPVCLSLTLNPQNESALGGGNLQVVPPNPEELGVPGSESLRAAAQAESSLFFRGFFCLDISAAHTPKPSESTTGAEPISVMQRQSWIVLRPLEMPVGVGRPEQNFKVAFLLLPLPLLDTSPQHPDFSHQPSTYTPYEDKLQGFLWVVQFSVPGIHLSLLFLWFLEG